MFSMLCPAGSEFRTEDRVQGQLSAQPVHIYGQWLEYTKARNDKRVRLSQRPNAQWMLLVLLQLRNKAVNSPHTRCFRIIGGTCDYISTSSSTTDQPAPSSSGGLLAFVIVRCRHRHLGSWRRGRRWCAPLVLLKLIDMIHKPLSIRTYLRKTR